MKSKKQFTIYLLLGFFLVNGCNLHQSEINTFQNLEYQQIRDIALSIDKEFCIILVDSTFDISSYKDKICNAEIAQCAIWNFVNVDINQNSWYKYLLGTLKTPFTLVFSPDGELNNITYGVSKYAIESIKNSLQSISQEISYKHFGFLENSVIIIKPQDISRFFDRIIKIKSNSDDYDNSYYDSINASIKDLEYPYNLYLKINYEKRFLHNDSCIIHAKELLSKYGNTYYANVFKPIFVDIHKLISKDCDIRDRLKLSVSPNIYYCNINDTLQINVQITNNTQSIVEIDKIEPSCNCITQVGTFPKTIPPKQAVEYKFNLIPEEEGEIYREIYFHTNSDLPVAIAEFKVFVK